MSVIQTVKDYSQMVLDSFKLYDRDPDGIFLNSDREKQYKSIRSFTDQLPWIEYLSEDQMFLLADERSVGCALDLIPVNAEGVMLKDLADVRDKFESFLNEAFPQEDECPWVVEFYQSDVLSLSHFVETVRSYVKQKNNLTNVYLPIMEKHLKDVCKEGGLFVDETVTGVEWRGSVRMYRMFFYRRYTNKVKPSRGMTEIEELKEQRQRVESLLTETGLKFQNVDGRAFYEWMFRWFNPRPKSAKDTNELLERCDYVENEDLPYGHDFAESLLVTPPVSSEEDKCWYFDDIPHQVISVQGLRKRPKIGSVSAPKSNGKYTNSMFDKMPEGTVMSLKITITPIEKIERAIERIESKANGEGARIERVLKEVEQANQIIANDGSLFPVELAFYVRGDDLADLRKKRSDVVSMLQVEGLSPIDDINDPIQLSSYMINLPMNFDPSLADTRKRSRIMTTQHIANLAPMMGRGRGTNNPGIMFFNRGGEPMCFDPFNSQDRAKNAHLCLFGPTGAGKSAQIVSILLYTISIYNARVFLVEAGNSFGMLTEFLKESGLSTNSVVMKGSRNITSIPPFANAIKALEAEELEDREHGVNSERDVVQEVYDEYKKKGDVEDGDDEFEFEKDYLGEMEIIARIMVSGGDKDIAKGVKLGDQQIIRDAILDSARYCRAEGRKQVRVSDVADELLKRSYDDSVPSDVRSRVYEYANAMLKFTQGLAGKIFNREGELWPECDFTHIDLASFVKDNTQAELAVAYMSILNNVNDIAERDQFSGRPIIFLTDEAHLITKNPLLAPGVVKIVKMWRKLGAWLWLATQNMADFPNEAQVMLSLFEWWLCLNLEASEVEEVARFKSLTEQQKHLLSTAKKQPRCFTEGVVLSSKMAESFRSVPPSIALSLAMSESDEKKARRDIMDELGCSEVDAAKVVAQNLDKARGLIQA